MIRPRITPERVNISHTSPDATVQQVLDQVNHEHLVVDALGEHGVQGVIGRLARRSPAPAPFSLDLIAHARRGVLHLGDWSVDGNGTTAALHGACRDELAGLALAEIRLLGCNTAITSEGQIAIRSLHRLFGVPVLGSKVPISARDFDGAGFRAEAVLTDQDNLPAPSGPTLQRAGEWFVRFEQLPGQTLQSILPRLRREELSDVLRDWTRTRAQLRWPIRQLTHAQLDAVLVHAMPELRRAPGLLALPELELVVPLDGGFGAPRYHRVTVLLEGHWLRLYPREHPDGIVLRTDANHALLQALRQGSELLRP